MLPKIFALLLCFAVLHLVDAATEEDTDRALSELYTITTDHRQNLAVITDNITSAFSQQLDQQQLTTIETIARRVESINSAISQIIDNVQSVNISTRCLRPDDEIADIQTQLVETVKSCRYSSWKTFHNLLSETNNQFVLQLGQIMTCHSQHNSQSNVEAAKRNVAANFEMIKVSFLNKVVGFRMPCDELIDFEISVFLDLYLDEIRECAEGELKNNRLDDCAVYQK